MNQDNTSTYAVSAGSKNIVVAYLLWWFLGWVGIHRFYLGKMGTGIAFIALFILGIPTLTVTWWILGVWWLLDAYFVYKYVGEDNARTGANVISVSVQTPKAEPVSTLADLQKLHELLQSGAITREEYDALRAKFMSGVR